MNEIEDRLSELERLGLDRRLRMVSGPQGPRVLLDGEPMLLLCSNNYLGLADHPRVREAAAEAAMRWGVGAGASRLVSGTMTIHARLEERLATFEGSEACVLFGSGYLANLGAIGALAGPGDTIFSDELNHASIIDGCRASRAEVVVYRHLDADDLERRLRANRGRGRRVIVTDSVFSMDGDVAPLARIVELAHAHGARTIVDEAHATGALGDGGRGAVAKAGLQGKVDVLVGTLGKALGSYGAYVCASEEMVRYLVNTARPLIFSTAPSPPSVAGALAALELLEEHPQEVERLHDAARTSAPRTRRRGLRRSRRATCTSCRSSWATASRRCASARRHSSGACLRRRSARRPSRRALRGCDWRRWPPTAPRNCARRRRSLADAAHEVGLDPTQLGEPTALSRGPACVAYS